MQDVAPLCSHVPISSTRALPGRLQVRTRTFRKLGQERHRESFKISTSAMSLGLTDLTDLRCCHHITAQPRSNTVPLFSNKEKNEFTHSHLLCNTSNYSVSILCERPRGLSTVSAAPVSSKDVKNIPTVHDFRISRQRCGHKQKPLFRYELGVSFFISLFSYSIRAT